MRRRRAFSRRRRRFRSKTRQAPGTPRKGRIIAALPFFFLYPEAAALQAGFVDRVGVRGVRWLAVLIRCAS